MTVGYTNLNFPTFQEAWKHFEMFEDVQSNHPLLEFLRYVEHHPFRTTQDLDVNFSKVSRVVSCANMLLKCIHDEEKFISSPPTSSSAAPSKRKRLDARLMHSVYAWNALQTCIQSETQFNLCAFILLTVGVMDRNMLKISKPHADLHHSLYREVHSQVVGMEATLRFITKWLSDMTEVEFFHMDTLKFASITKSSVGLYDICNAPERIHVLE